jgi:hypothetical protein
MSLDAYLTVGEEEVYWFNITHNLTDMADSIDLYEPMWHPERLGITKASELIEPLEKALVRMAPNLHDLREHEPDNGWGTADDLLRVTSQYLEACRKFPDADVLTCT